MLYTVDTYFRHTARIYINDKLIQWFDWKTHNAHECPLPHPHSTRNQLKHNNNKTHPTHTFEGRQNMSRATRANYKATMRARSLRARWDMWWIYACVSLCVTTHSRTRPAAKLDRRAPVSKHLYIFLKCVSPRRSTAHCICGVPCRQVPSAGRAARTHTI